MTLNAHSGRGRALPGRTSVVAVRPALWRRVYVRTALWLAALVCGGLMAMAGGEWASAQPAPERAVLLLDIKGAIGFVSAEQLTKALQRAKATGAEALIVRIDTPGGLLSSTRDMIHAILASPVPVVMYVAPNGSRAASAGTYLMYASHVAAMAPSTHLGAATPVALSPGGFPGTPQQPPRPKPPEDEKDKQPATDPASAMERKVINDAVAYIRGFAELRGRNGDWAEKAVREGVALTASAALKERVIDLIAKDVDDLLAQVHGRTVTTPAGDVVLETKGRPIVEIMPDWKQQIMSVIADPNIALILMMIGIYGILLEFWHPGVIAPGVIGAISLIVALAALSVLPVNYAGLALLLLGVALMVAEAFLPSFGIAGIGGVVAFALGALFLFDPEQSDIPIQVSWQVVAGLTGASAAFFLGLLGFATRARLRPVRTGAEELIGSIGEVVYWEDGQGRIRVHGEIWTAKSGARLARGQQVRVVSRTGLTLAVEPSS
jgi:membrane-bound serine protease (ClpP class)